METWGIFFSYFFLDSIFGRKVIGHMGKLCQGQEIGSIIGELKESDPRMMFTTLG